MPPPRKRPRLHFICSVSPPPGSDIDAARRSNDLLLKTRWESVFEKYERDFEGIGDEIGFVDDEIVVNNGHLRRMQNEGDIGIGHKQETTSESGGKRLLRAMTTAPSECASSVSEIEQVREVHEVIQSIETMATHTFADDYSSDDDLFHPSTRLMSEERPTIKEEETSDTDALFDFRHQTRSPSVDSLFDPAPGNDFVADEQERAFLSHTHDEDTPSTYSNSKEKDILQEQRLLIRHEVMNLLNEQKEEEEAKLEPAWRIPVIRSSHPPISKSILPRLHSNESSQSRISRHNNQKDPDCDSDTGEGEGHNALLIHDISEQEQLGSLWRPSRRKRRTKKAVVAERNLERIRAESEDPLQGEFPSDRDESMQHGTMTRPVLQNQERQQPVEHIPRSEQSSSGIEPIPAESIISEDDMCIDGSESETSNSDMENHEASPRPDRDGCSPSATPDPTPSDVSEKPAISPPTSVTSEKIDEDSEEWEVEKIADSRVQGQKRKLLHYKVIWKGYDPTWSTWKEVLPGCDRLVQQFHLKFPDKPGPPKGYSFELMSEGSGNTDDPI